MNIRADDRYLLCEQNWVYYILITVAGFWGAFTYVLRGHVFCNAQTGNMVLLGLAIGSGELERAGYYFVPIAAYLAGTFISEFFPNPVKHSIHLRWETLLIGIEIAAAAVLGLIPDSYPVQISQVLVNFIASMQFNTFRQAQGTPMATTFVTNHVRQVGICLAKELQHRGREDKSHRIRLKKHVIMILCFTSGVAAGTALCSHLGSRAIWFTIIPLAGLFYMMLRDDRTKGAEHLEQKPLGH